MHLVVEGVLGVLVQVKLLIGREGDAVQVLDEGPWFALMELPLDLDDGPGAEGDRAGLLDLFEERDQGGFPLSYDEGVGLVLQAVLKTDLL